MTNAPPAPVVLVIDDEPLIRNLLCDMIEARGCVVAAVDKIGAARQWLAEHVPHAVFCDVMLPDGTGFELCKWIRNQASLKKTPLVMMTAISDEETAQDAVELLGIVDFLRKPFDLSQLDGKLDKVLPAR